MHPAQESENDVAQRYEMSTSSADSASLRYDSKYFISAMSVCLLDMSSADACVPASEVPIHAACFITDVYRNERILRVNLSS